ncbi:MAG: ExeM/NucH family extracellular endonuclease [Proteobacteria bacterium]|nr:ExeM/NucH family extracellular endonuclease [Pseudomonadota bacterium]
MVGSDVIIRGIITRLEPGTGFYIEESGSDASPTTSNAIFVEDPVLSHAASLGQMIMISGQVAELGQARDTLTALTEISSHQLCDANIDLPQTHMELPLNSRPREAMESMRITLDQNLTVSDVYKLHRGEVTLSAGGVLAVPTEHHPPGPLSASAARKNRQLSVRIVLPGSSRPLLRTGSMVDQATGIMGNNGKGQVFLLEQPLKSDRPQPPKLRPPENNNIRLVSFNLLNFFNGDGRGGGFPTERGAKTYNDFLAQANRIRSAIAIMKPHLLAVQELENDGFGPLSAARTLVKLLNESGQGSWSAIEPTSARIGKDVITVGLFYRSDILQPAGPAHILDSAPFRKISRQPLAQLFQDHSTGQRFLVAVNHFKSKGSCPKTGKNSDQRDGQGCWNPARVAAAKAVTGWVNGLAVKSGTDRILILGDMNAWRNEDPVRTFRNQGFTELVEQIAGLPQHSYVYQGETGTLDYAFASDALLPSVSHAEIWHINSDWPPRMELPSPWLRSSDHDPVVVDLDFSQLDTSD